MEDRTHYSCPELHWLPVQQWIDHKIMLLGVQMLQGYSAWILAGTHSLVCSCMTPLLIIATTPMAMDSKCCWKTHLKTSLVSEPFPTLLPSCGMPYHKQSGKQTPWLHSADVWKCTCSVNDFTPCVLLFLKLLSIRCSKYPLLLLLVL